MQILGSSFIRLSTLAIVAIFFTPSPQTFGQSRVIEVLADKDSHFKIAGMSHPEITVKAGEPLLLRVSARTVTVRCMALPCCGPRTIPRSAAGTWN